MIDKSDKHYSHSPGNYVELCGIPIPIPLIRRNGNSLENFQSPQISEKIPINLGNDGEWGNLTKNHSHSPGMGNVGNIDQLGNFHSHSPISPGMGNGNGNSRGMKLHRTSLLLINFFRNIFTPTNSLWIWFLQLQPIKASNSAKTKSENFVFVID